MTTGGLEVSVFAPALVEDYSHRVWSSEVDDSRPVGSLRIGRNPTMYFTEYEAIQALRVAMGALAKSWREHELARGIDHGRE